MSGTKGTIGTTHVPLSDIEAQLDTLIAAHPDSSEISAFDIANTVAGRLGLSIMLVPEQITAYAEDYVTRGLANRARAFAGSDAPIEEPGADVVSLFAARAGYRIDPAEKIEEAESEIVAGQAEMIIKDYYQAEAAFTRAFELFQEIDNQDGMKRAAKQIGNAASAFADRIDAVNASTNPVACNEKTAALKRAIAAYDYALADSDPDGLRVTTRRALLTYVENPNGLTQMAAEFLELGKPSLAGDAFRKKGLNLQLMGDSYGAFTAFDQSISLYTQAGQTTKATETTGFLKNSLDQFPTSSPESLASDIRRGKTIELIRILDRIAFWQDHFGDPKAAMLTRGEQGQIKIINGQVTDGIAAIQVVPDRKIRRVLFTAIELYLEEAKFYSAKVLVLAAELADFEALYGDDRDAIEIQSILTTDLRQARRQSLLTELGLDPSHSQDSNFGSQVHTQLYMAPEASPALKEFLDAVLAANTETPALHSNQEALLIFGIEQYLSVEPTATPPSATLVLETYRANEAARLLTATRIEAPLIIESRRELDRDRIDFTREIERSGR